MHTPARGRPPASSREVLADAAIELFLEQGYEATSVTEIARRVGISRASFFNYFTSKPETLWFVLDQRIFALEAALAAVGAGSAAEAVAPGEPEEPWLTGPTGFVQALAAAATGARPDTLALAIVDARTMGVEHELARGRADRQLRVAAAITARLIRDGTPYITAEVMGAGYAAALFAAVWAWAASGAGRHPLDAEIERAVTTAHRLLGQGGATPCDPETRSSAQ